MVLDFIDELLSITGENLWFLAVNLVDEARRKCYWVKENFRRNIVCTLNQNDTRKKLLSSLQNSSGTPTNSDMAFLSGIHYTLQELWMLRYWKIWKFGYKTNYLCATQTEFLLKMKFSGESVHWYEYHNIPKNHCFKCLEILYTTNVIWVGGSWHK